MYPIRRAEKLADKIYLMDVEAPRTARSAEPGQFLIVKIDARGERIPLTICDYDRERGLVTIVFQVVGASTERMAALGVGDAFDTVVGPLGRPSEMLADPDIRQKKVLFVAGGVGTAPVYPQVKWLRAQGVAADVVIGARSADLLILQGEMEAVAGGVYIATNDGSAGVQGMVTDVVRDLVQRQGRRYDLCVAIGPMVMMKFTAQLTRELGIPTVVSLNPIMVDGTGMCGACRVSVGGQTRFACVDGPEFDGHLVDFDGAMKRQQMYRTEEGRALLRLREGKTHRGGCGHCGGED